MRQNVSEDRILRILRTIFEEALGGEHREGRMVVILEDEEGLHTSSIPDLAVKLEQALPGILPSADDTHAHMCGTGESRHDFREEIESGMTIPHLLEHVILHLLGRSNGRCSGFSGQRSADLEKGITSHYYVVTDCSDKLQAIIAAELAYHLVCAWLDGRTVKLDREIILNSICERLEDMLLPKEMPEGIS